MNPRTRYQADLAERGFHADPLQAQAVDELQRLHEQLTQPAVVQSWWRRMAGRRPPRVQGLYLCGGPGRGKTWLMDCFHAGLALAEKRRLHFHRFMLEIHAALDALPKTRDPLDQVAGQIAADVRVLCLDEFHVTDIADAMLLAGLLDALFRRGLVLVATSNTVPGELYRDGLQRHCFLPAISALEEHTRLFHMGSGQDYRLALLQHHETCRVADSGQHAWLRQRMHELSSCLCCPDSRIQVSGRQLQAVAVADDVVWFHFDELCLKPRSARDYLELAREFHTLLLEAVPVFATDMDEAARRFMHLVDALYDHGVKLIMTSAVVPSGLYADGNLKEAFRRTSSRLTEMGSTRYLARAHRPE